MSRLSFRTPLETIHVEVTAEAVTLTAPQFPADAEWSAAYRVVRDMTDERPELFHQGSRDVYVYRRI